MVIILKVNNVILMKLFCNHLRISGNGMENRYGKKNIFREWKSLTVDVYE